MARELGPQGIEMSLARNAPEPPSMSIEEVKAAVEAEGLTLITDDSSTGFLGVGPMLRPTAKKKFRADIGPHDDKKYLGTFATAEEAALAYARALGPEGVKTYLETVQSEAPPMTKEQVLAAVASEGLALVRSRCKSGYKNVTKAGSAAKPFKMTMRHKHTHFHLGVYATLEEAALAYARAVGPEQSREEAAAYEQVSFFSTGTRHRAAAAVPIRRLRLVQVRGRVLQGAPPHRSRDLPRQQQRLQSGHRTATGQGQAPHRRQVCLQPRRRREHSLVVLKIVVG